MQKICILFRGEHQREYIKYTNAIDNYSNFKNYIFDDLQDKYIVDIVFVTYQTNVLCNLIDIVNPNKVIICDEMDHTQINNFKQVNHFIQNNRDIYDRFVILRFDILYKIKITEWPLWFSSGIIVPNKDDTFSQTLFCNDIVFIIDNTDANLHHINNAVNYMIHIDNIDNDKKLSHHPAMPHHIGQYFNLNNIPLNYMYDMCANTTDINHPLYIFQRYL